MYLRLSPYQEILQGILTDLEVNEGIIKVTGRSGAGKTALCTQLFQELQNSGEPAVLFLKPPADATDLQKEILARLNLDNAGNFTRTLTAHLVAQASPKPLVLIFDDAHLLDQQTFSAIRMLCNIQDKSRALIRVIICGNEELDTKLAAPALRAVAQFLSQSLALSYLTREQVHDFCQAYWQSIGVDMKPLGEKAQQKLYLETQGHPGILHARLNQDTTGAEKTERSKADASADEEPRAPLKYTGPRPGWIPGLLIILALLLLIGAGGWFYFNSGSTSSAMAPATGTAPLAVPAAAPAEVAESEVVAQSAAPEPILDGAEPVASAAVPVDASAEVVADVADVAEAEPQAAGAVITSAALAESPATSVERFLAEWAQDWQNRDVDAYLANYHENFAPPQGLTRSAWEEQQRNAIGNAQDLVITNDPPLSNTEAQDGMRLVRFWMNYRAADAADRIMKEILLVPVDGTWRIRAENNLSTERQ